MKKSTQFVTMSDGKKIVLHTWIPEVKIKAVVQLSHGMVEHSLRYERLAAILCSSGFAFYAHDHRGHGKTAENPEDLGFLCQQDGFNRVVADLTQLIDFIHEQYPGQKVFLLGHSFGSFISQAFIEQNSQKIDGCILSGSAGPRLFLTTIAALIAKCIQSLKGKRFVSLFIHNLSFGSYNRRIKNPKTKNDWLTRDEAQVQKYNESPLCTFTPTISFYYELFYGLTKIHKKKAMKKIRNDLPIFLFAGDADPVGSYGKTLKKLYHIYKKNGIKDVEIKLYNSGRHEMLNEINKDEVEGDVLAWINQHL
ncbi:MAG: lysophospholipase [Treponemataceae bacterium]